MGLGLFPCPYSSINGAVKHTHYFSSENLPESQMRRSVRHFPFARARAQWPPGRSPPTRTSIFHLATSKSKPASFLRIDVGGAIVRVLTTGAVWSYTIGCACAARYYYTVLLLAHFALKGTQTRTCTADPGQK
jgi:hypothetical protein